MINKDYEEKSIFSDAVKSIINLIKKSGRVRIYPYLEPEVDLSKLTWHLELKAKEVYPKLYEFENEIMKLESVRKCLDWMLERDFPKRLETRMVDKDGKPVENPNYEPFLMGEILGILTSKYLESHRFEFDEEKFENLYTEMRDYVYSESIETVVVVPLENFELKDMEEFSIDGYKLRRLTEWEMKTLIEFGYPLGSIFKPYFGNIETLYCIERVVKTPKRSIPPLQPYIEDLIIALRLFKEGNLGYSAVLYYPKIWRTSWGFSFLHRFKFTHGSKYIISKDDIPLFTRLYNQYNKIKSQLPKNVRSSIRWFNKSYEDQEEMDKLLDLAIALEVLFGASNRLDLYVPHLITSAKEERLKLNEDIEKLREMRGAIVHSGYSKVNPEFIKRVESITRLSIQKFLELLPNSRYEDILQNISKSLL